MDHVADANARLSLLGLSIGYQVFQDDNSTAYQYNGDAEAVQIIGAGTEAANGYYTKRGTLHGRPWFNLLGHPNSDENAGGLYALYFNGTSWNIYSDLGSSYYTSSDDVAYPWLVTTWTQTGGALPVPTTAHIPL